tara:strand:- start:38453 stop:38788 length:336 start_codon:yes stop_codon:yes gene_type:complete
MIVEIHIKGRRKIIGDIVDGVFYKKIKGSKHIYKKIDGIGVDAIMFDAVVFGACDEIKVLDTETSTLYTTTPKRMKRFGQYVHHKPYRAQIILGRYFWNKEENYKSKNNGN